MLKIFNFDTGKLRDDILIFKKSGVLAYQVGVDYNRYSESGNLYDRFGKLLISGTFLIFERRKLRKETIIEIKT